MSEEYVKSKTSRIVHANRMALREVLRKDWVVNAEPGTSIDEILDPVYWSHMSPQMEPLDRVEVFVETGEWMLELLVRSVGRSGARVSLLHRYDLENTVALPSEGDFKVEWLGPMKRYCVVRKSDSHVLQEGLFNQESAVEWLASYEISLKH